MAALSTIALATLAGAGAINQYSGQRRQAKMAEQEGEYAAQAYEQNAKLAELQRADALARGRETESRFRTGLKGALGENRAATAAQGVDLSVGSAVDVQHDIEAIGELDALTIRNNAAREAWGYQVQAMQDRQQAGLARTSGRNQATALRQASLGSLLTGAADVYGVYSSYRTSRGPRAPRSSEYGTSAYGSRGMFG